MSSQLVTPRAAAPITFEEFERRYAGSGRAVEYWHGEIVEKSVSTWLHSVLQAVLVRRYGAPGIRQGPTLTCA